MKRKIIDTLIEWKDADSGKAILLTGVKGVGKTYLAYDFAKAFFDKIYYLNFELETDKVQIFQSTNTTQMAEWIFHYFSLDHEALSLSQDLTEEEVHHNGILILDEVYGIPNIVELTVELQKSGIFPKIIAISSNLLSKEVQNGLQSITVFPMQFDEFLKATGNEWYIEVITYHFTTNKKIPEIVHQELLTLYQLYLQIGGMPGSINEYLNLSSTINIAQFHCFLTGAYHDMIGKRYAEGNALKMKQVLDSMVLQLLKDNTKFQYRLIRKGTTYTMYKDAIETLTDAKYVMKCNKLANSRPEDRIYTLSPNTNFKLYLQDIGLLYSQIEEVKCNFQDNKKFQHNREQALLENYAAQALQAKGYPIAFWESDSMAKIDFIIAKDDALIPIEIHCGTNTRSKSISVFRQKYQIPYAIKVSYKNYAYSEQIKYIPCYALFCI